MHYQAVWQPNQLNEAFWREVLEGRTIRQVEFNATGIRALVLDNGERLHVTRPGSICVVGEHDPPVKLDGDRR